MSRENDLQVAMKQRNEAIKAKDLEIARLRESNAELRAACVLSRNRIRSEIEHNTWHFDDDVRRQIVADDFMLISLDAVIDRARG